MADFKTLNGYVVKDPNAGRSLSVNGNQLQLKNPAGSVISTVNLPGGGGKAVIAEVTAMTTPEQWGTDESLSISRYADGEYNTLNVSDIHDLLANGAIPYISYDNVLIAVDDVSIAGLGFSLSATTTVRDYNKAFGNPAISGNDTDTVSITVTYDTMTDTAVGNYSTGGGGGGSKAVFAQVSTTMPPDQWGTDESLSFYNYQDGGSTLNAADIAQYLADGAIPYILFNNQRLVANKVWYNLSTKAFRFSASTTIADYNEFSDMTPLAGNTFDLFSITVTSDGGSVNYAVGNYWRH